MSHVIIYLRPLRFVERNMPNYSELLRYMYLNRFFQSLRPHYALGLSCDCVS